MKTLSYFVLMTLAVLFLGARCDREDKPDVPPETPPVEKPQEPTKKGPDDFTGPDIRDKLAGALDEHKGNDRIYYTFFQYCNDSDHTIWVTHILRCDPGTQYTFLLLPGEKDIHTVAYEYFPAWGYDDKLLPLQNYAILEAFYDQDKPFRTRAGIYEVCTDFTQTSDTACIGDESQWQYDEFDEHIARWTYIFTNGDYDRAVKISAERTDDPEWID